MNKLVIIGNGFDLAHGLKTSYKDFVLWYLNKSYNNKNKSGENDLIKISGNASYNNFNGFKSISDFTQKMNSDYFNVKYYHPFFKFIINSLEYNWVDIELDYYRMVKLILGKVNINDVGHVSSTIKDEISKLNECLDLIRRELIDYLKSIDCSNITKREIIVHFQNELGIEMKNDNKILF